MAKSKIIETTFVCLLMAITIVVALYASILNGKVENYKKALNNSYESSFYSLNDEVNSIESTLSKLSVSNDEKMQEKYLTEICSLCEMAQNDLSALPLEHNMLSNTYKFVNQLGGYAFSLNESLEKGETIDEQNKEQIGKMHKSSQEIKNELNNLASILGSNYSIVDNISSSKIGESGFSENFHNMYDETIKYPTLIYDGPFSDSLEQKEVKGLLNLDYTKAEAEQKVKKLFEGYNVSFSGETEGKDHKGIYPSSCVFTRDLHSLGQFIQEGNKILFLSKYKRNKEYSNRNNTKILLCW